ncbi:NACHT domain-containing protein [Actinoplanes sp. NPDC051513]|uniref:NACHT domain-containing protein n=1 Tax=Actinoplanes sp. NPDC051513 TaxID=3363908 RepID=UPI0037A01B2D
MGREVSYEDAVKLLGGDQAKVVRLLDTLMGVGLLVLVGPFRDVLGWFDAKAELGKVTERLVSGLVERRSKLGRYERTERLRAAHAVLALTAFFEAMAEAKLPVSYRDLELTASEQRTLGEKGAKGREPFAGWTAPVPESAESHEDFRAVLRLYYVDLATTVEQFVGGLAVWERLGEDARNRARAAFGDLAEAALARYDSLLGKLAADYPEVAFWAGMREHAAGRERLRVISMSVTELGAMLAPIAAGRAPDERRRGLSRAYAAALKRPVVESGEAPIGLMLPTLGEAFVPQRYRAVAVSGNAVLSNEGWWERLPVRDDLLRFLTCHLTSTVVARAPLLILGQPGSGKSVLTRILAAELPATDFLPVLVVLRAVSAAADPQDQIEQAIRAETGERVLWPELARSADGAMPVVILDGFDELLQATRVSQTDYLQRVAAFQRREADQGRPVAVIVTSRLSVADRAEPPEETVAVRLEPFDRNRVAAWLKVWNRTNEHWYSASGERPLDLATVMRYPRPRRPAAPAAHAGVLQRRGERAPRRRGPAARSALRPAARTVRPARGGETGRRPAGARADRPGRGRAAQAQPGDVRVPARHLRRVPGRAADPRRRPRHDRAGAGVDLPVGSGRRRRPAACAAVVRAPGRSRADGHLPA